VVGTKGAGAGLRGAGAAAQGSRFATVVRVGGGLTRAGEFLGRIPTVSDLAASVRNRFPSLHVPTIDVPDVDVPTPHVDTPRVDLPEPGRVDVPDGPSIDDTVRTSDTPGTTTDAPGRTDNADSAPPRVEEPGNRPESGSDAPADRPDNASDAPADRPEQGAAEGEGAGATDDGHGVPADAPDADVPDADAPDADHDAPSSPVDPPEYLEPADVPEPLHRSEPLPTQELGSHYRGENDPTNPHRAFYPDTVEYMSPARLEEHRVVAVDGRLYWADDGSRLDTAAASTAHSGGGRAMFVMDEHGNLYVSLEQRVGELHHSSFLSGRPVAGAGELVVVDGVPTVVSRKSGHYRPTEQQQEAVRDVLDSQGVDVSGVTFESGFGP
jgi:hypothetical protein